MSVKVLIVDDEENFVVEEIKNTEAYSKYVSQKIPEKTPKGLKKLFRF